MLQPAIQPASFPLLAPIQAQASVELLSYEWKTTGRNLSRQDIQNHCDVNFLLVERSPKYHLAATIER